jgi:CheY-like chemotaxis protein
VQADPDSAKHFEWARHKTRGELLDLVLDIEERLREWVRTVLIEHADATGVTLQTLVSESISSALHQSKPTSLDDLTLAPLIDLVLHRWALFEDTFGGKAAFSSNASEFRMWRNKLAHGHTPTGDEKVHIAMLVRQVGQRIPGQSELLTVAANAVQGAIVLWVDDRPEGNHRERRIFRALGIRVVPVRSNSDAVMYARTKRVDLVISDIHRGDQETGLELPEHLRAIGVHAPVIYYVGMSLAELTIPPHAHSIHDDPAQLLIAALTLLTQHSNK